MRANVTMQKHVSKLIYIVAVILSACSAPSSKINYDQIDPVKFSSSCFSSLDELKRSQMEFEDWAKVDEATSRLNVSLIGEGGKEIRVANLYSLCTMKVSAETGIKNFRSISLGLSNISNTKFWKKSMYLEEEFYRKCQAQHRMEASSSVGWETGSTLLEETTSCGVDFNKSSSAWRFEVDETGYEIYSIKEDFFIWRN